MRKRLLSSFAVIVLVALAAFGLRSGVGAQDATTQGHPLVGTWLADTDTNDPANAMDTFTFSSDGGYIEVDATGDVQLGAWEATGGTTAILKIVSYQANDDGTPAGGYIVRASIEVAADGNSFTASYTFEFLSADGSSSGQAGPGTATGTRIVAEAPGTPVMSLEDLFSSSGGPPEATPIS